MKQEWIPYEYISAARRFESTWTHMCPQNSVCVASSSSVKSGDRMCWIYGSYRVTWPIQSQMQIWGSSVYALYLHIHCDSWPQILRRSQWDAWLCNSVSGSLRNEAQHEVCVLQEPLSFSDTLAKECSITQQPVLCFASFLVDNTALVRARPFLCSGVPSSPWNPRYSRHCVPWPVSPWLKPQSRDLIGSFSSFLFR